MDAKKYAAEAIGTFWLTFADAAAPSSPPAFRRWVSDWSGCPWRSG